MTSATNGRMSIAGDNSELGEVCGIGTAPFEAEPDPGFVYPHGGLQQVCAELLAYELSERPGLFLISGAPGTGKSVLLRKVLEDRRLGARCGALSGASGLSFEGLVEAWCTALGIAKQAKTHETRHAALRARLTAKGAQGETLALLLDDAQLLADGVLRGLCALAVPGGAEHRSVRIVLAGRPELEARLARRNLSTVRQSVAVQTRLQAMAEAEVEAYVRHRLAVAGHEAPDALFSAKAVEIVARASLGVPRVINILCRAALEMAAAERQPTVSVEHVEASIQACLLQAQESLAARNLPPPPRIAAASHEPAARAGPGPPHPEARWPIVVESESAAAGVVPSDRASYPVRPHRLTRSLLGLLGGLILGLAIISLYPARLETPDTMKPGLLVSAEDDKARALEAEPAVLAPAPPVEAGDLGAEPAVLAPAPPVEAGDLEAEPAVLAPAPPVDVGDLGAEPAVLAPAPPVEAGDLEVEPAVLAPAPPVEAGDLEAEPAVLAPAPPVEAGDLEAEPVLLVPNPSVEAQRPGIEPTGLPPELPAAAQVLEAEPVVLAPKPPVKPQLLISRIKASRSRDTAAMAAPSTKPPTATVKPPTGATKVREQQPERTSWFGKLVDLLTSAEPPQQPRRFGQQSDR